MEKRKEYHILVVDAHYNFKDLGILDSLESINEITINYNTEYDSKTILFNDELQPDLDSIIGIVLYDGNRAIPYHVQYEKNTKHSCKRQRYSSQILKCNEDKRKKIKSFKKTIRKL